MRGSGRLVPTPKEQDPYREGMKVCQDQKIVQAQHETSVSQKHETVGANTQPKLYTQVSQAANCHNPAPPSLNDHQLPNMMQTSTPSVLQTPTQIRQQQMDHPGVHTFPPPHIHQTLMADPDLLLGSQHYANIQFSQNTQSHYWIIPSPSSDKQVGTLTVAMCKKFQGLTMYGVFEKYELYNLLSSNCKAPDRSLL